MNDWNYTKDSLPVIPDKDISISCLVTLTSGRVIPACFTKFWVKEGEFTDPSRYYADIDSDVVAWMYMPEPAKPKCLQHWEETLAVPSDPGFYCCEACGYVLKDNASHCSNCGRTIDWYLKK